MALKCLKGHSDQIASRRREAFSAFDTFCQLLKIEFSVERCFEQHRISEQSDTLLGLKTRTSPKAKRKYIEIIRIFKA